jgi:hypothetical protein
MQGGAKLFWGGVLPGKLSLNMSKAIESAQYFPDRKARIPWFLLSPDL